MLKTAKRTKFKPNQKYNGEYITISLNKKPAFSTGFYITNYIKPNTFLYQEKDSNSVPLNVVFVR